MFRQSTWHLVHSHAKDQLTILAGNVGVCVSHSWCRDQMSAAEWPTCASPGSSSGPRRSCPSVLCPEAVLGSSSPGNRGALVHLLCF